MSVTKVKLKKKNKERPYQILICIMGKAGTGKDTLLKTVCKLAGDKVNEVVLYTTRPKRENEVEGKDYFFISEEDFITKIVYEEFYEYKQFNNWYYGTGKQSLVKDKINIGVFNPKTVHSFLDYSNIYLVPVYIDADKKIRLLRQLNREANPDVNEIIRRFGTDEKDFENLTKDGLVPSLNNNKKDFAENVQYILSLVDKLS